MRAVLPKTSRKAYAFWSLLILLVLVWIFRTGIFKAYGSFLDISDEPEKVEILFVLGGNTFERGSEALALYNKGITPRIACSGANIPNALKALGRPLTESQLSKEFLVKNGVNDALLVTLSTSTSTLEESNEILNYCTENGFKNVGILSSSFHLRRVRMVCEDKFEEAGIQVVYFGSGKDKYNKDNWWQHEEGIIFAVNEGLKLIWYWLKY